MINLAGSWSISLMYSPFPNHMIMPSDETERFGQAIEREAGMARAQGKVAIVTGGGSGIGRACCLRLAEEGAKVVVTDISEERGRETVGQIEARGGDGLFLRHDVTREDQWESVVARTKETYGGVDVLVNNAGLYLIKALAETTVEEWNNLMAVNVTGVFLGADSCRQSAKGPLRIVDTGHHSDHTDRRTIPTRLPLDGA